MFVTPVNLQGKPHFPAIFPAMVPVLHPNRDRWFPVGKLKYTKSYTAFIS